MLVFCNLRTCINMLMKKTSLAGNPCTGALVQRQNDSLTQINKLSRQAILPVPSAPTGESHLPGYRKRTQPPANLFLPKVTATTPTEAAFESGMGAPKSKQSGEVF